MKGTQMNTPATTQTSEPIDFNASQVCQSLLEQTLRQGAQQMLQGAIEEEVTNYLHQHREQCDDKGHRLVVGNGRLPARQIQTGLGPVEIQQPRVRDKRADHQFTSAILPPYLRRVPALDNLIPALYLKGVSMAQMVTALQPILGEKAGGLSPTNIQRLLGQWQTDHRQWEQRDLDDQQYVYLWADGIYFNVRLTSDRPCLLVLVGARADGTKELVAVGDGQRESKLSWQELLRDLKQRGLTKAPKVAIGDGAHGFWAALEEEYSQTRGQRCWVHKTANVLDKLPRSVQPSAKSRLHDIYLAPTRKAADQAWKNFMDLYEKKYPKACQCLVKDQEALFTFYDFPAEHWTHLRTTNPIESTFATVRHRTRQTKGNGSRQATLAMVFQLLRQAEGKWRKLNGSQQLDKIIAGVIFIDGDEQKQQAA